MRRRHRARRGRLLPRARPRRLPDSGGRDTPVGALYLPAARPAVISSSTSGNRLGVGRQGPWPYRPGGADGPPEVIGQDGRDCPRLHEGRELFRQAVGLLAHFLGRDGAAQEKPFPQVSQRVPILRAHQAWIESAQELEGPLVVAVAAGGHATPLRGGRYRAHSRWKGALWMRTEDEEVTARPHAGQRLTDAPRRACWTRSRWRWRGLGAGMGTPVAVEVRPRPALLEAVRPLPGV